MNMSVTASGSLSSLRGLAARCQPSGSAPALSSLASNTAPAVSAAMKAAHLPSRALSTTDKSQELELTLALIKPSVCSYQPDVSAILKEIKQSGLNVARSKRIFWTSSDAHDFYAEHRGRFYYDRLIIGMISGPAMALALVGPNAIKRWRTMLGPTKAYRSKYEDPQCLRSRYGLGDTRNGFHGSDSPESAARELGLIFDGWDTNWWLQREQGKLPTDQDGKLSPLSF